MEMLEVGGFRNYRVIKVPVWPRFTTRRVAEVRTPSERDEEISLMRGVLNNGLGEGSLREARHAQVSNRKAKTGANEQVSKKSFPKALGVTAFSKRWPRNPRSTHLIPIRDSAGRAEFISTTT